MGSRDGSFVLVHKGAMTADTRSLSITVAPDSGTEDLVGLSGSMDITIVDGNHDYAFEYDLAEPGTT